MNSRGITWSFSCGTGSVEVPSKVLSSVTDVVGAALFSFGARKPSSNFSHGSPVVGSEASLVRSRTDNNLEVSKASFGNLSLSRPFSPFASPPLESIVVKELSGRARINVVSTATGSVNPAALRWAVSMICTSSAFAATTRSVYSKVKLSPGSRMVA